MDEKEPEKQQNSTANRILFADDEDSFMLPTARLLEKRGYFCQCVKNGDEAYTALKCESFDLVILDVNMPGNERLELMKKILKEFTGLPVIIVTGSPTISTAVDALRLSVCDYVLKPLEFPDFFNRVSNAVKKGRLLRDVRDDGQAMKKLMAQMKSLEHVLSKAPGSSSPSDFQINMESYLNLVINQIGIAVNRLKTLCLHLNEDRRCDPDDVCLQFECPRLSSYEQALHRTVQILHKTRNSFKSKELGALRKDLESLIGPDDRNNMLRY